MSTEIQNDICSRFQSVGRANGYDRVSASFFPFKDFKACWQRTASTADFKITDYLEPADGAMIEEFAECLFKRIKTKGRSELYTPRMREWFQSEQFLGRNRPIYLRRSRNLAYASAGRSYELEDSYRSLVDQGLVRNMPGTYLTWTRGPNRARLGYCSVLMRVIAVSSALDNGKVPEYVTEYVLYHELLHLQNGLRSVGRYHDAEFKAQEKLHPRHREAEDWLKRVAAKKV